MRNMKQFTIIAACSLLFVFSVPMTATTANVSIGNADYTGQSDLPKDKNDAIDMAAVLRGGADVKIDRTEGQMRGDVQATDGSPSPRIVYVSSHGAEGPPAELIGVDNSRYDANEFAADLKCQDNEITVVILDACYSGGMAHPAVDSCCIFLTACRANECTQTKLNPPRDARNSKFTEWVLRGVRGAADANSDDEVTLLELHNYLEANYDNDGLPLPYHHEYIGGSKPGADTVKIFKPVSEQPPPRVPSLTSWGLLVLLVLLVISGIIVIRQRRRGAVRA